MAVRGLGFIKSAERWQKYGETYHDEARIYFAEINKACLTIATFLIGFIGIFLQIGSINTSPLINKALITIAFIAPIVSIAFGIYIFYKVNEFMNKAGDYYDTLSERLHLWIIKCKQETGDEYPSEIYKGISLKEGVNPGLSYAQITFLAIGFLSISLYFMLSIYQPVLKGKYNNSIANVCVSKATEAETNYLKAKGYQRMTDGSWQDPKGNFPNGDSEIYLNQVYNDCIGSQK